MKRILSVLLALVMMASMATVAFAFAARGEKPPSSGEFSGIAEFNVSEVDPGDTITLDVEYFYGKWTVTEEEWDDKKEKDVKVKRTYDNEDEPIVYLEKEYHKVSATWTSGGNYIQSVYFEDGDGFVTIEFKGTTSTVDRDIVGTIKIRESGIPNRPDVTYECKIKKGTLTLKGVDEKTQMVSNGERKFSLPDDYQTKQVRFAHDEDGSYGTFIGEFESPDTGDPVAEYRVRIIDQSSLFLGFSEAENKTVAKAYPDAELRFLDWTARPKFDNTGTLSIYMDPDEFIYGINDDNTLYRLGGSWDDDNQAYVISTKTLGSYVISDIALTAGSSGGASTVTSSPASTPSSAAAPSSTAPAPAPAPSSTAPPPASTAAPSSSSEESSEPEEESSEPEDEEPEDPEDEDPFDLDDDDDDDDDDEDEKAAKKKFPIVPVLFGVLGVSILVAAVVVVGQRSGGSGSRSRRRRYDDDWDD